MQLDQENWDQLKEKIKDTSNEIETQKVLKYILGLLIQLNQCALNPAKIPKTDWEYYLQNFILSLSKNLTFYSRNISKEIQNLTKNILRSIILLFQKIPTQGNLHECFKMIMDPKRNFNRYLNQTQDLDSQLITQLKILQKINKNQDFTKALKKGDSLDAVKSDYLQNLHIWAAGKINNILDNQIEIIFMDSQTEWMSLESGRLAPINTHSQFYLSQKDLKIGIFFKLGDTLDCYFNGRWYLSTIIEIKNQDQYVQQINVGLRQYDQEGPRIDSNGRNFFGLGEQYDQWINVILLSQVDSCRILPAKSITNHQNQLNNEDLLFDSNDYLLKNFQILSICRENICTSQFLVDNLNDIYQSLNKIFEQISQNNDIELVKNIMLTFDSLSKIFLKHQGQIVMESLGKSAIKAILSISKNNLRSINNNQIDFIFITLTWIFGNSETENQNILINFQLERALIYLNSDILERQIQGLRIISEIQKCKKYHQNLVYFQSKIQWIKENDIFCILNGKKSHIQLIQRQQDVLKLMLQEKIFKDNYFDLLLSQIKKNDHEFQLGLQKLLIEISSYFSIQQVEYLIRNIIQNQYIKSHDIDFMYQLISKQKENFDLFKMFLEYLWNLIFSNQSKFNKKGYDVENESFEKFMKIIINHRFSELRLDYLIQSIEKLKNTNNSNTLIKIIKQGTECIKNIQLCDQKQNNSQVIQFLIQNHNLLQALIDDLKRVKDQNISQNLLNNQEQFEQRLEFIFKLIKQEYNSDDNQYFEFIEQLQQINVENQYYPQEINLYFHFLAHFQENAMDQKLSQFFQQKMMNSDCYQYFKIKELQFLFKNFCDINESKIKCKPNYLTFAQFDYKTEFGVLPNELEKLDNIWTFCLKVKDQETYEIAIQILISIYTYHIHPQSLQIFIQTFLNYLKNYEKDQTAVKKLLDIIYSFLNETEQNGPDEQPAFFIPQCYNTLKFQIHNEFSINETIFFIKIKDTQLIKDLKILISEKIGCFWSQIELEVNKQKIKESQTGMLIRESGLQKSDKIVVMRKSDKTVKQAELMINGEINPKLQIVFQQWFLDYSVEGKMYINDCVSFINSITGDNCESDDRRVKDLYNQYDQEDKGYLELRDFLTFYKEACLKKPRIVWSNLSNKNLQNDFCHANNPQINKESLARTYLFRNQQFITQIQRYCDNPKIFYLLSRIPDGGQQIQLNKEEIWFKNYDGISIDFLEHECKGIRERVIQILQQNQFNNIKPQLLSLYYDMKPKKNTFFKIIYKIADQDFLQPTLERIDLEIQLQKTLKVLLILVQKEVDFNPNLLFDKLFYKLDTQGLRVLYELTLECLKKNGKRVPNFLKNHIFKLIMKVHMDLEYSSQLLDGNLNPISSTNYVGIKNLGCICYMNAALQQFFMIPCFRYGILMADDQQPPNMVTTPKQKIVDDNLLHQIQLLFGFLSSSIKEDYDPYGFCFSFKDYEGNPTNVKLQQDSQEVGFLFQFINILFDKLEYQLKNSPFSKLIDSIFKGQTCSTITCLTCGNQKKRNESFYNLEVDVKNQKTLVESLQSLVKEELIQDYNCDICNQKRDIKKNLTISHCPNYLIIHLKRFIFDMEIMENEKINTSLEFDMKMNFQQFCEDQNQLQEYELSGILVHIGVAQFGHYISYIKQKDGSWLEFNDSQVTPFDPLSIDKNCFGKNMESKFLDFDSNQKTAYMLFYEKKVKQTYIIEQKNMDLIPKGVFQAKNSEDIKIDLEEFPQYIPTNIYNLVKKQNKLFTLQKNMLHISFQEFFINIFQIIKDQELAINHLECIEILILFKAKIMHRHQKQSNPNNQLSERIQLYINQFLNQSKNYSIDVAEQIINQEFILDALLKSNDKTFRKDIFHLLLECINNIYAQDSTLDKQRLNDLITYLINYPIQKNNLKLSLYFDFLLSAIEYPQILDILKTTNHTQKLIKLFLEMQNYNQIESLLQLIKKLMLKIELDRKITYHYIDRLIDLNQKQINSCFVSALICSKQRQQKDLIFFIQIMHMSFYLSGQEIIIHLFTTIKEFLLIDDEFTFIRISLFFGIPLLKLNSQNQYQTIFYEYPSPIQLSNKQTSFLDLIMTQRNKFNILYYIKLIYKLINKSKKIHEYIYYLPSPSPNQITFLQWLDQLLKIIKKESQNYHEFEFDEQLQYCLQQNEQNQYFSIENTQFQKIEIQENNQNNMQSIWRNFINYEIIFLNSQPIQIDFVKITQNGQQFSIIENQGDCDVIVSGINALTIVEGFSKKKFFLNCQVIKQIQDYTWIDLLEFIKVQEKFCIQNI